MLEQNRIDADQTRGILDYSPAGRPDVLVVSGVATRYVEMKSDELFDLRTETWRDTASMNVARCNHRAPYCQTAAYWSLAEAT